MHLIMSPIIWFWWPKSSCIGRFGKWCQAIWWRKRRGWRLWLCQWKGKSWIYIYFGMLTNFATIFSSNFLSFQILVIMIPNDSEMILIEAIFKSLFTINFFSKWIKSFLRTSQGHCNLVSSFLFFNILLVGYLFPIGWTCLSFLAIGCSIWIFRWELQCLRA